MKKITDIKQKLDGWITGCKVKHYESMPFNHFLFNELYSHFKENNRFICNRINFRYHRLYESHEINKIHFDIFSILKMKKKNPEYSLEKCIEIL